MKNIWKFNQLLFVLLVLCSSTAVPQVNTQGPIELPGTVRHTIYSQSIQQNFRLYVSLPESYESSIQSYPVVFVLDGDSMYTAAYASARTFQYLGLIPEIILVGIGYETVEPRGFLGLRYRDYTPTVDEEQMRIYKSRGGDVRMPEELSTGGAEIFHEFIESEIKPFINSTYRADSSDETLMGVSLGGLFATYVLFNHTDTFERYVIASPSLWFDSNISFEYEENYAGSHADLNVDLFMSVGSLETPDIMLQNIQDMAQQLNSRNYPKLDFVFTIFEGETHLTTSSTALKRGLLSVFSE